jgi:hypothetical protein
MIATRGWIAGVSVAALFAMAGCQGEPETEPRRAPGTACSGLSVAAGCTASVDRPCIDAGGDLVRLRETGRSTESTYCRIDGVYVDGYSWFRALVRKERSGMSDFFTDHEGEEESCESLGGMQLAATSASGASVAVCRFSDESAVDLEAIKAGPASPANQKIAGLLKSAEPR